MFFRLVGTLQKKESQIKELSKESFKNSEILNGFKIIASTFEGIFKY